MATFSAFWVLAHAARGGGMAPPAPLDPPVEELTYYLQVRPVGFIRMMAPKTRTRARMSFWGFVHMAPIYVGDPNFGA